MKKLFIFAVAFLMLALSAVPLAFAGDPAASADAACVGIEKFNRLFPLIQYGLPVVLLAVSLSSGTIAVKNDKTGAGLIMIVVGIVCSAVLFAVLTPFAGKLVTLSAEICK